jgi:cytochrome c6
MLPGKRKEHRTMKRTSRFGAVLAAVVLLVGVTSFAQSSGEATYKTKCQSCHGASGAPSPAMAKAMGVKPIGEVKSTPEAKMIAITTNGEGKMPAFKGKLTDAQIKDSVSYFRSLAK